MTTHVSGPMLDSGADPDRKWFLDLPLRSDPDHVVFWDDFTGIAVDSTNDWTVVKDTSATVAIAADTENGRLALTSEATTENDGASIQANEIFAAASGRSLWFEAKIQVSNADEIDLFVGLTENFATNPEAVLTASNRIGFQINDGDASILCKTESGDTESSTDSGKDAADDTDVILGFRVDATNAVYFYVDRVLVATHTSNIPTALLTPAVMELSGTATGTISASLDYILAVQTR